MSPADKISAGIEAKRILSDLALVAAFETVERQQIERWRKSDPDGTAAREDAWHVLRALEAVKDALRQAISDGEFAGRTGR